MLIGSYNLSGDARALEGLDNSVEPIDMTAWADDTRYFMKGLKRLGITGFQALLNDEAAGAFSILKNADVEAPLSLLFGSGAEPAVGDPVYLLSAGMQISSMGEFAGGAAVLKADFIVDTEEYDDLQENPWGVILHEILSLSATKDGDSVNNLVSTASGGHGVIHILASDGGTWEFKIQDSPNDSAWSDLLTFTVDGSAIASEQLTVSGTIDQYLQIIATRTSGTVTPAISFARN
jgi:hypothetical protein